MDERVRQALAITLASPAAARTVDITTTGARTGLARRMEIWFYRASGEIYLTSPPARRSWYVNLVANPEFTFHLKHGLRADLAAHAEPILDDAERRRIFSEVIVDLNQPLHRGYLAQPVQPVDEWVAGSPLMHITFDDHKEAGTA